MKMRGIFLCGIALLTPMGAHAGFEFMPGSSSAAIQQPAPQQVPAHSMMPEPTMPVIPAVPVTSEPLSPPTDRVLSRNVSRPQDTLQINPVPLQRRIPAPAGQPFDGEALLDATILGNPIALASESARRAAAPVREININPFPLQGAAVHNDSAMQANIERGMMESEGSLRGIAVPGGRIMAEQQTMAMAEPAEFIPPTPPRKPNVPVQAFEPAAQNEDFAEAVGFGRDLPLALALSQVVPPGYNYSFGQNVDAGTTVSWQGGKPWNEVLQDMLAQSGLRADMRGKQVMIKSAGI